MLKSTCCLQRKLSLYPNYKAFAVAIQWHYELAKYSTEQRRQLTQTSYSSGKKTNI